MAYKKRDFIPLSETHPKIASEAYGWDPSLVRSGSGKRLTWICSRRHTWEMSPNSRVYQNQGCPFCSGHKVLIGFNDLNSTDPALASQAIGWDPKTLTRMSSKIVSWICSKGHKWNAKVANRSLGQQCPYCTGKAVMSGFNDLSTTNPDIALEAWGWDPSKVSAGSDKKQDWKCPRGHVWSSTIGNRTRGNNCPVCANKKVLSGFNDLATTHPQIANEAHEWDPRLVFAGSHKKLAWKCQLGHIWQAQPNSRTSMKSQCPVCDGVQVLVGFNDLESTHPFLARQAKDWDPKTVTRGSKVKRIWQCELGHTWKASPQSRTVMKSGCPTCSKTGFDPNKDGYLYFLIHERWGMYQIGITNVPDSRLAQHAKLGWEVIEVRGPMDGFETRQWEQDILQMLRHRGVELGSKKGIGKFDGYTEAWSANVFQASSIHDLFKLVSELDK